MLNLFKIHARRSVLLLAAFVFASTSLALLFNHNFFSAQYCQSMSQSTSPYIMIMLDTLGRSSLLYMTMLATSFAIISPLMLATVKFGKLEKASHHSVTSTIYTSAVVTAIIVMSSVSFDFTGIRSQHDMSVFLYHYMIGERPILSCEL